MKYVIALFTLMVIGLAQVSVTPSLTASWEPTNNEAVFMFDNRNVSNARIVNIGPKTFSTWKEMIQDIKSETSKPIPTNASAQSSSFQKHFPLPSRNVTKFSYQCEGLAYTTGSTPKQEYACVCTTKRHAQYTADYCLKTWDEQHPQGATQ